MGYAEHFSIANIPYGIASGGSHAQPAPVTRLGDLVFFLADLGLECSPEVTEALSQPTLNLLAARPKDELRKLRAAIQGVLSDAAVVATHGVPIEKVQLHLPVKVEGFTDFSCSKEHLQNMSEIMGGFRMVPPGFLHFPIGYGGRASSVVVSGTPIIRPHGQFFEGNGSKNVVFGPSREMDYELEMAAVIGRPTELGDVVSLKDADEHIFGLVLVNDWSSRDIQGIEMMPLGPHAGKSFGTSISPWIITLEALESFESSAPTKESATAAYLNDPKPNPGYDITLEVEVVRDGEATRTCQSKVSWMYWTFRDLVAHQTVNGCSIRTGDLLATGTVSGPGDEEHGCLGEMTWGGKKAWTLQGGQERRWLEDGDEVRLIGWAGDGKGVGFGECTGVLKPAKKL